MALAGRSLLVQALLATRGHHGQAAELLRLPRRTYDAHLARLLPAEERTALAAEHGWPTRADLAAFARQHTTTANAVTPERA